MAVNGGSELLIFVPPAAHSIQAIQMIGATADGYVLWA
jgi:hypothetical protein